MRTRVCVPPRFHVKVVSSQGTKQAWSEHQANDRTEPRDLAQAIARWLAKVTAMPIVRDDAAEICGRMCSALACCDASFGKWWFKDELARKVLHMDASCFRDCLARRGFEGHKGGVTNRSLSLKIKCKQKLL